MVQVIENRLALPSKYFMIRIDGETEQERFANAQAIAASRKHNGAFYVERKPYKASAAYLFLVMEPA